MCGIVPAIGAIGATKVLFGGGGGGSDDKPESVKPIEETTPLEIDTSVSEPVMDTPKTKTMPSGPSNTGLQIGGDPYE